MITTRNLWISPLERLYALQREIDRAFEAPHNDANAWAPPTDVVETADEVLCHIEVPGVKPEDIEIQVEENQLVVSGEKKFEASQEEGGYRAVERRYGRFERSFTLPRTIDSNNVRAHHEHGVLTIVLPKAETSKPRRIRIEGDSSPRELNR
jgi:HSP20 family protein